MTSLKMIKRSLVLNLILKIMKVKILCLSFLTIFSLCHAQDEAVNSEAGSQSIALKLGTLGAGLQYTYAINDRWQARMDASYFKSPAVVRIAAEAEYIAEMRVVGRVGGIGLMADYNLSSKTPNWKLAMGLYYNFTKVTLDGAFTLTATDPDEDLGTLLWEYTTNPVNPYAGIVFGNFKSDKKIGFAIELGTLYHGAPKVDFTGSGRIEPTSTQDDLMRENVKDYAWFPMGSLQLIYKIK
ncbi:MAG: hypothetical protein ACI91R_002658 [Vicingaceae bacterium]|jgi:hypothetical protein